MKTPSRAELGALIQGIGGEIPLLLILCRFYEVMAHDVLIGFFFDGRDILGIARHQADFLLFAAGLKEGYAGKRPGAAHSALPPILSGHFDRRLVLLREVLVLEGLSSDQVDVWLRFEESFRKMVVA